MVSHEADVIYATWFEYRHSTVRLLEPFYPTFVMGEVYPSFSTAFGMMQSLAIIARWFSRVRFRRAIRRKAIRFEQFRFFLPVDYVVE